MTLELLSTIARNILDKAHILGLHTATVITLHGDLGAGKTTLTQEIAQELGVKENLISPTFVIMKKYEVNDKKFNHLIHIDAYRLTKSEELIKLGWKEILEDKKNLIIIEWPENVPKCIPAIAIKIEISHTDEDTREIIL